MDILEPKDFFVTYNKFEYTQKMIYDGMTYETPHYIMCIFWFQSKLQLALSGPFSSVQVGVLRLAPKFFTKNTKTGMPNAIHLVAASENPQVVFQVKSWVDFQWVEVPPLLFLGLF